MMDRKNMGDRSEERIDFMGVQLEKKGRMKNWWGWVFSSLATKILFLQFGEKKNRGEEQLQLVTKLPSPPLRWICQLLFLFYFYFHLSTFLSSTKYKREKLKSFLTFTFPFFQPNRPLAYQINLIAPLAKMSNF